MFFIIYIFEIILKYLIYLDIKIYIGIILIYLYNINIIIVLSNKLFNKLVNDFIARK